MYEIDSGSNIGKMERAIKLEKRNECLTKALNKMNERLGDETIDDSDDSLDDDYEQCENVVNTRHHEIDGQFLPKHYFITNVSEMIPYH